jgi:hypothetical protein
MLAARGVGDVVACGSASTPTPDSQSRFTCSGLLLDARLDDTSAIAMDAAEQHFPLTLSARHRDFHLPAFAVNAGVT